MTDINYSLKNIEFRWDEVDCFLRPQTLICNNLLQGCGSVFLFLTLAFRSHGIQDFFTEKSYFVFLKEIIEYKIPLKFEIKYFEEVNSIFESLVQDTTQNKTLIIPSNIKNYEFFKYYRQKDWEHYFIINNADLTRSLFFIRDHLHLDDKNTHTQYENFNMPFSTMKSILQDYYLVYVGENNKKIKTFHNENKLWTLEIALNDGAIILDEIELCEMVIALYLDISRQIKHGVDEVQCNRIKKIYVPTMDFERLNFLIKTYMKEINFYRTYHKILAYAIRGISQNLFVKLEGIYKEFNYKSNLIREELFLKMVKKIYIHDDELTDYQQKIFNLDYAYRNYVVEKLLDGKHFLENS